MTIVRTCYHCQYYCPHKAERIGQFVKFTCQSCGKTYKQKA